jgi:hypothetical protein
MEPEEAGPDVCRNCSAFVVVDHIGTYNGGIDHGAENLGRRREASLPPDRRQDGGVDPIELGLMAPKAQRLLRMIHGDDRLHDCA